MKLKSKIILIATLVATSIAAIAGYERLNGKTYFVNVPTETTVWRGSSANDDMILLNTIQVFDDTICHLQAGGVSNRPGTGHFILLDDASVTIESGNDNLDVEWELDSDGNLEPKP